MPKKGCPVATQTASVTRTAVLPVPQPAMQDGHAGNGDDRVDHESLLGLRPRPELGHVDHFKRFDYLHVMSASAKKPCILGFADFLLFRLFASIITRFWSASQFCPFCGFVLGDYSQALRVIPTGELVVLQLVQCHVRCVTPITNVAGTAGCAAEDAPGHVRYPVPAQHVPKVTLALPALDTLVPRGVY